MFRKIRDTFAEFGIPAGCLYALDRLLQRISASWHLHVYELMVQPVTTKALLPKKFGGQLEIREIKPADAEIALMPVRPDVMRERLRQDTTCIGAFKNQQLVGYMWFCRRQYDEDEVRCTYVLEQPDVSVFDFDFYLFPEHRMGLAFAALWNGANAFLSRNGIRYTFSRLTRFNVASRRAHQHLGWKLVGRALFLQLGRFEMMLATLAPFVTFSVAAAQRVRLTLGPAALR
jgi:hypothetical protein